MKTFVLQSVFLYTATLCEGSRLNIMKALTMHEHEENYAHYNIVVSTRSPGTTVGPQDPSGIPEVKTITIKTQRLCFFSSLSFSRKCIVEFPRGYTMHYITLD